MFRYPHLLGIGIGFPMLQGPFMFLYVLVMINKTGKFKSVYWLHGLPFLIFAVYFMFDFYFLSAPEKLAYYKEQMTEGPNLALIIMSFPNILFGPAYVVWSLVKLKKHVKNIADNFSYTEQINLNWLKYILGALGFVWFTVIFANVLGLFPILSIGRHDHVIYLAVTIAMFFIGYFGIKQQAIYINTPTVQKKKHKVSSTKKLAARYTHSGLKETEAKEFLKKLLEYMEKDKIYLNGKLSLREVAEHLDVSVNHLSQIINEQSIIAGPSLNFYTSRAQVDNTYGTLDIPNTVYTKERTNNKSFMWIGLNVGLAFTL